MIALPMRDDLSITSFSILRIVYLLFIRTKLIMSSNYLDFAIIPNKRKDDNVLGLRDQRNSSAANRRGNTGQRPRPFILAADECPQFADQLSNTLDARGLTCFVANDGKEVLSVFLDTLPDVTILSFGIAGKEDGIETAKKILRMRSNAKVVILTDSESKVTEKIERMGVEFFINKNAGFFRIANSICALSNLKKRTCNLVNQ